MALSDLPECHWGGAGTRMPATCLQSLCTSASHAKLPRGHHEHRRSLSLGNREVEKIHATVGAKGKPRHHPKKHPKQMLSTRLVPSDNRNITLEKTPSSHPKKKKGKKKKKTLLHPKLEFTDPMTQKAVASSL